MKSSTTTFPHSHFLKKAAFRSHASSSLPKTAAAAAAKLAANPASITYTSSSSVLVFEQKWVNSFSRRRPLFISLSRRAAAPCQHETTHRYFSLDAHPGIRSKLPVNGCWSQNHAAIRSATSDLVIFR